MAVRKRGGQTIQEISQEPKGIVRIKPQAPADPRRVKTLCLIRHAKSSWKFAGLADVDRPLSTRGRREAALMGGVLAARGFAPDRWFSSPALRALRTAEALAGALGWSVDGITLEQRLYERSSEELLAFLQAMDDAAVWVVCVGHNPELTDLAYRLSSQNIANVPTCGVVEMRFAIDRWQSLGETAPLSVSFDFPKNHL